MTWAIISGILIIILCWVLFAPLFLYVNTDEEKYSAGLKWFLNFNLIPDEDHLFCIRISVVFYSFNFFPLKKKEKKTKADLKEKKSKKKKKRPALRTILLIKNIVWKIVKSFRLKKLYINMDTNDVMANAYLIPVFANLHRNNINLYVNYSGDFKVIINIENNIFRMLVVTIQTYLHHKKIL